MLYRMCIQHKHGGALNPVPLAGGAAQENAGRLARRKLCLCSGRRKQTAHAPRSMSLWCGASFKLRTTVPTAGMVRLKCVMQLALQGWGAVAGDMGSMPCPKQRESA